MADNKKETVSETESFEMIELAIDNLELLTRAFTLIKDICEETEPQPTFPLEPPEHLLN
jgi:hypothetical protein